MLKCQFFKLNKKIIFIFFLLLLGGCNSSSETEEVKNEVEFSKIVLQEEMKLKMFIEFYKRGKYDWAPPSKLNYNFSPILLDENLSLLTDYSVSFVKRDGKYSFNHDYNFDYSWGTRYEIIGEVVFVSVEESVSIEILEVISKEEVYQNFSLQFKTHFEEEPLIEKVAQNRYIAYNELEFQVYYQDLQEELDLRLDNNRTISLNFNFEKNGTVYLESIAN
jgi:hypothetical protein